MPKSDTADRPANQWLVLAGFMVLCLAVGSIAGWATNQSVTTWYLTLNRPSWTPSNWLFAPAWTLLYVMMAVAAWQVWLLAPYLIWVSYATALNFSIWTLN